MYTLLIWMVSLALKVAALWNEKIRLFVDGRKKLFSRIEAAVKGYDDIIWKKSGDVSRRGKSC